MRRNKISETRNSGEDFLQGLTPDKRSGWLLYTIESEAKAWTKLLSVDPQSWGCFSEAQSGLRRETRGAARFRDLRHSSDQEQIIPKTPHQESRSSSRKPFPARNGQALSSRSARSACRCQAKEQIPQPEPQVCKLPKGTSCVERSTPRRQKCLYRTGTKVPFSSHST